MTALPKEGSAWLSGRPRTVVVAAASSLADSRACLRLHIGRPRIHHSARYPVEWHSSFLPAVSCFVVYFVPGLWGCFQCWGNMGHLSWQVEEVHKLALLSFWGHGSLLSDDGGPIAKGPWLRADGKHTLAAGCWRNTNYLRPSRIPGACRICAGGCGHLQARRFRAASPVVAANAVSLYVSGSS